MEPHLNDENENASTFDTRMFFLKVLKNYLWFIAAILFFIAGAYLFLRFSTPLYQAAAYAEVQQKGNAATILGGSAFTTSGKDNDANYTDINSEIFKIQSATLVGKVVDSLQLFIEVTEKGRIKNKMADIDLLPFSIVVKKNPADKQSQLFKLTLGDLNYQLQSEKYSRAGIYNRPLVVEGDTITIQLNKPEAVREENTWELLFLSRQKTIQKYTERLLVGPVPKGGAGMLQIVMRDEIPNRAKRIIEVLMYNYDHSNYIFKNKSLRSEIAFLDKRLDTVSAELEIQENYIRSFKANNKINDVSSSATQVLSSLTGIDTKKSDNDYRERLLRLVESNINTYSNQEERINVPGLQDVDLSSLVGKYNDLVYQKNEILERGASMDLRLPPLNTKLGETKSNILRRIGAIRQELVTNNGFLMGQERSMTNRFVSLPGKEKDYIQVNRLLNIKQSLYVFLLQRREDKNIEYASSSMQGTRIVDWRVSNVQDPPPILVYGIGLLAALLLPAVIIFIRFLANKRIESSAHVYKATSLPIAGEIAYVRKLKEEMVIQADNVSPVAEQFRTLRTNMYYINAGSSSKVLLITSGQSGEGKSFISLNLASALAVSDKKVVLLEFDLRDPGLNEKLQLENPAGLSDYLSGELTIEQVIQPVKQCPNLFYINSGSFLPANPGEIIHSSRMQGMFDYLRQNFDFIVMDTPPIEAVSDALTLGKWADSSFFVIRHKYSLRSSLVRLNQLFEDKKLPRPALIINGIKTGDGFNNVYGYGYGYGYGNTGKQSRKKDKTHSLKIA